MPAAKWVLFFVLVCAVFFLVPVSWKDPWLAEGTRASSYWGARNQPKVFASYPRVTAQELCAYIRSGKPLLIDDVRSSQKYSRGHIPGAKHMPGNTVQQARKWLDKGTLIVLYDDWPGEYYAASQEHYMLHYGFKNHWPISILKGGFTSWEQSGCGVRKGTKP